MDTGTVTQTAGQGAADFLTVLFSWMFTPTGAVLTLLLLAVGGVSVVGLVGPAKPRDQALQACGRGVERDVDEVLLDCGAVGHPGDGPHLRVRQLPGGELGSHEG